MQSIKKFVQCHLVGKRWNRTLPLWGVEFSYILWNFPTFLWIISSPGKEYSNSSIEIFSYTENQIIHCVQWKLFCLTRGDILHQRKWKFPIIKKISISLFNSVRYRRLPLLPVPLCQRPSPPPLWPPGRPRLFSPLLHLCPVCPVGGPWHWPLAFGKWRVINLVPSRFPLASPYRHAWSQIFRSHNLTNRKAGRSGGGRTLAGLSLHAPALSTGENALTLSSTLSMQLVYLYITMGSEVSPGLGLLLNTWNENILGLCSDMSYSYTHLTSFHEEDLLSF